MAGSSAISVPEILQYAGDEDCQAWQLEEEVELATLATEIRSIMSSSLLQSGALLLRGLKVVFKYSPSH